MKTLGIVCFLGLLVLWTELPPACGQKGGGEGRSCPPDEYVCIRPERNECENNAGCRGGRICCQNQCAKRCVFPVKRGTCPIDICKCIGPQPNKCEHDFICKGRQKCCYKCCAMQCVDPK